MKSRKMVLMNLFIEQEYIDVENCGHSGGKKGWDKLRE